ncbi:MAG: patatin-like phospholipase family protein [Nitrospinota bacterium]|nr:MAG: patatin-like phospholipase family protein [Nitrospinota bacterium]
MSGWRLLWSGVLLFWIGSGCAHYPLNAPLSRYQPTQGYRFAALRTDGNTNSLFLCLTFSGGGTRAAALAYGVLQKLKDTPITWKGKEKRLLDEVDCISAVSGGSFTAAYYALFHERLFTDFRTRFLERNIEHELKLQLFSPANLFRLLSPYFSRIDLAAELYHTTIFDQKTFADLLARGDRPFLILNATNLANGERFEFTQDQFDFLGSDLSSYPVARAVAASSAFPFLLSPISLQNYPPPLDYSLPDEYKNALQDYETNRRRFHWARNQIAYLDATRRPYLHLMDGGLADNIGLRAIENAYRRSNGFIRMLLNAGEIETLALLVVNARTAPQERLSQQERPPGLVTVGYKTATISLDNYSFETVELMKDLQRERLQAQRVIEACQRLLEERCPGGPPLPTFPVQVRIYVIEVNFEAIRDEERRHFFLNLPTSFALPSDAVQALIAVGPELLDQSSEFQRFLQSMNQE